MYLDSGVPMPARSRRRSPTCARSRPPRTSTCRGDTSCSCRRFARDDAFSRLFFSRLQMLFYAAAGLRQEVADAFEALAVEALRRAHPLGHGARRDRNRAVCAVHRRDGGAGGGRIGVPVAGRRAEGGARRRRARSAGARPEHHARLLAGSGAHRAPRSTSEGYYCMGDAVGLVDPSDPARGFTFQGRLTEDFKLSTGTWVRVGPLRAALLAAPRRSRAGCRDRRPRSRLRDAFSCSRTWRSAGAIAGAAADEPVRAVLARVEVCARFRSSLTAFSAAQAGSSTRVERAMLLDEPPSIDAEEITDKRSLNQQAVLRHRRRAGGAAVRRAGCWPRRSTSPEGTTRDASTIRPDDLTAIDVHVHLEPPADRRGSRRRRAQVLRRERRAPRSAGPRRLLPFAQDGVRRVLGRRTAVGTAAAVERRRRRLRRRQRRHRDGVRQHQPASRRRRRS